MITRSAPRVHTNIQQTTLESWQNQLANCVTCPKELLKLLGLDPFLLPSALQACNDFSMRIPRAYIAQMEYGNADDPLLKQVLPIDQELEEIAGFTLDPLAEQSQNPIEGVIHKYQSRLLLITSGACAINCRFCFRRHFPYSNNQLSGQHLKEALGYIQNNHSIKEVILSGGDPLAASDNRLKALTKALANISHVKTLRIHTRMPVVIPHRITEEFLDWFTSTRLKPVMVIHCNHANEISDDVKRAMNKLKLAGVTLLNQTVLLKDINDDAESLINLSETLFDADVLPYYLHLLDKVQGAAHYDVPESKAQTLITEMMHQCSGYLVPKLVREIAGEPCKTQIPVS